MCLLRSSVDSAKEDLANAVVAACELAGASTTLSGAYPGWKPNFDSAILKTMKDVYRNLYGKPAAVKVIHAGLECGIFGRNYPDMDYISFGPTIEHPHSPGEKVNIPSVAMFWEYFVETLKNI
jgi:dipeptidase D